MKEHTYSTQLVWQGSTGAGYRDYPRQHAANAGQARQAVALSADPHFHGDGDLLNPEQLLVMATSSCQLLSFLAVAALRHVDVVDYRDAARGYMPTDGQPMRVSRIELSVTITVARGTDHALVRELVDEAHAGCFIARSLNSDVNIATTVVDA